MVSIVCACMNRHPALQVALVSWLQQPGVLEVVIVDWSSEVPLSPLANIDPRVQVVRVDSEPRFHHAAAFNLAADCASHPVLLKLDADHVLNPYVRFLAACPLPEGGFVTGDYRHPTPFYKYLNGMIHVRAADWNRVHGYNEHLIGYGWEDDDFYDRLVAAGVKRWFLNPDRAAAFHIPHGDDVRIRHCDDKNVAASHRSNRVRARGVPYAGRLFSWQLASAGERVRLATRMAADMNPG
jgi:glycosyltransferase involved in cell wall biosynthesis